MRLSQTTFCSSPTFPIRHTFTSIKDYNSAYSYARIRQGQDTPDAWRTPDCQLQDRLLQERIEPPCSSTKQSLSKTRGSSSTRPFESCDRFNRGSCSSPAFSCLYPHTCSGCRGPHPLKDCPSSYASSSNSIPLRDRIHRPGN